MKSDRLPGDARRRAMGISIHTGWAACVVVAGSLQRPEIVANERIDILDDSERFCFHMAADMQLRAAQKWLAALRRKAVVNARKALAPLTALEAFACAIVAKDGSPGDLEKILASHPRIHSAEGCFYRDVLREASTVPVQLVAPASLDISTIGKLARPPWGRDQIMAALAAWSVMKN